MGVRSFVIGVAVAFLQGAVLVMAASPLLLGEGNFETFSFSSRVIVLLALNCVYGALIVRLTRRWSKLSGCRGSGENRLGAVRNAICLSVFSGLIYLVMQDAALLPGLFSGVSWFADLVMFISGACLLLWYCAAESFVSAKTNTPALPSDDKYGRNRLPDFVKDAIVESLDRHMKIRKPWLCPDLTLAELAEQLGVAAYQLSQVINAEYGISFQSYINRYRINHACELLDSQSPKMSIMTVATAAGFSSKSTFNAIFRREKNVTPSEYRSARIEETV